MKIFDFKKLFRKDSNITTKLELEDKKEKEEEQNIQYNTITSTYISGYADLITISQKGWSYMTRLSICKLHKYNNMAPENMFLTLVHLYRIQEKELCNDYYYFDKDNNCVVHQQTIEHDEFGYIGGTEKPDKNIDSLIGERDFITKGLVGLSHEYPSEEMIFNNPVNFVIRKHQSLERVIQDQKELDEYTKQQ